MDVGPDVRRRKNVNALAKVAEKGFLEGWLKDNEQNFMEVMALIKDGSPVKYAELYLKAYQMGLVKEQNINININRQQDRENLQALVRSRIPASLTDSGTYTPYEEVRAQPIEVKRREDE